MADVPAGLVDRRPWTDVLLDIDALAHRLLGDAWDDALPSCPAADRPSVEQLLPDLRRSVRAHSLDLARLGDEVALPRG